MTRKTYDRWLRRYARAYMELQMTGSYPTEPEQKEAHDFWKQVVKECKAKLHSVLPERNDDAR